MIVIQSYQELYSALKVIELAKKSEYPVYKELVQKIEKQIQKLL